nr:MAG: putative nucleocapsid [Wufeng shrew chuvirus 2]
MAQAQFAAAPLMRRDTISRMFQMAGRKPTMYTTRYIDAVAPIADRTNPFYVSAVAGLCVSDLAGARADVEVGTIVQCCCIGFDDGDLPTEQEAIAKVKTGIRDRWASLPATVRDPLCPGGVVPGWVNDAAVEVPAEAVTAVLDGLKSHEEMKVKTIGFFTTGLLSFCKQGNVTNGVMTKVTNAIRDELGHQIIIDPTVVRSVWNICGPYFDHVKARFFFELWEVSIGSACLRLRLLCNQAGWTGLTNFQNIGRARDLFPTFNWAKLAGMIPTDFTNFTRAVATINGDKYFGYKPDLGEARATLYPNLSYAAYQLLMVVGGDRSLRDFRGTNSSTPFAAAIDVMIREFEGVYRAAMGQVDENPEVANAFANLNLGEAPGPAHV